MSRFVSAGSTEDAPNEKDGAWLQAQKKIDATRLQKNQPLQPEGSLYDKLQANKAAKQEAFEEATKLRNQFQSLDEDEVEFLDSILESSRKEEAEVRKDIREQLEAFRRRQEKAEKASKLDAAAPAKDESETTTWTVAPKKRKKGKEALPGVKLRRTSTAEERDRDDPKKATGSPSNGQLSRNPVPAAAPEPRQAKANAKQNSEIPSSAEPTAAAGASATAGLGLGAYSSDEED